MVEPVDPFMGSEFDSFEVSPGSASMNDLGLVKTVDSFGQCIVVGVADAANGEFYPDLCQSLKIVENSSCKWLNLTGARQQHFCL